MNKRNFIFKIAISIILILYLVFWISLEEIITTIKNVDYAFVLFSIPLIFLLYMIRAVKWGVILKTIGIKTKVWTNFKVILIGLFYGLFTPAKAGELARVYFLRYKKSRTVPSVIWDKFIDGLALLTLSVVVALLFFRDVRIFIVIIAMTLLILFILFFVRNEKVTIVIARLFKISEDYRRDYFESMLEIGKNKKAVIQAYFLGLLYYFVGFAVGMIVLRALSPKLNPLLTFSLPLIILFGNAPLTISGLGLREFIAAITFRIFNAPISYGFSFSILLFIIITFMPGMIGYILNIATTGKLVRLENIPGNYYDKHHSKNIIVQFMMDKFHKDFDALVKKAKPKTLFDIGCGEGYTTDIIKRCNKNVKIVASDIDKGIIEKAKRMHKGIKFSLNDVYNLKFKGNNFDCAIASELLEHLDNPDKAIKEMRGVSKRHCIFSVPKEPYWRMANILRLAYISRLGNTPGHVQNWTTGQFRRLLEKHFKNVEIKSSTLWNIALCKK